MGITEVRYGMYTDDSNSMLALCSSLVEKSGLDPEHAAMENCRFFLHTPKRCYSDQTEAIMLALINGEADYLSSGNLYLPKGSWANGAAMKIAPIGIAFSNAPDDVLYEAVRLAVISTHTHREAIDGAWIQAKAISVLLKSDPKTFNPRQFLEDILNCCKTEKMKNQFKKILQHYDANSTSESVLGSIMNSVPEIGLFFQIRATQAVPLAIWALAKYYKDPEAGLVEVVSMGGDTDTVAAMSGALFGALSGTQWIQYRWWNNIENAEYGRDYVLQLAKKLSLLNLKENQHNLQK